MAFGIKETVHPQVLSIGKYSSTPIPAAAHHTVVEIAACPSSPSDEDLCSNANGSVVTPVLVE